MVTTVMTTHHVLGGSSSVAVNNIHVSHGSTASSNPSSGNNPVVGMGHSPPCSPVIISPTKLREEEKRLQMVSLHSIFLKEIVSKLMANRERPTNL